MSSLGFAYVNQPFHANRFGGLRLSGHDNQDGHSHGGPFGDKTELIFVALSGLTLITGWALTTFTDTSPLVPRAILAASYVFGGTFALREAFDGVRRGRFQIDSLMLVAAVGAAVLGKWSEGALLLFLFSLGHALESYSMGRAKRAIEALGELAPETARVRRDGAVVEVSVESLGVGDVVIVRSNDRLPADGFVISGRSSVNQAPITGESVPVDKKPVPDDAHAADHPESIDSEHRVFAGTINGSGALEVRVTRKSADSALSRVVAMVREAKTNKSPTQRFTDRIERVFVPTVLVFATLLMFAWVVLDEPFSASFYRSMGMLVAASPCALAISTPSAVLSGIARAARGGVLVKGGAPLEELGRVTSIAFDKTGTLTEGKPRLIDIVPADGVTEQHLLSVAVAMESLSDHPLAGAVVAGGTALLNGSDPAVVSDMRAIAGRGLAAEVGGITTHIGKRDLFDEIDGEPIPPELQDKLDDMERNGRTTMVVRQGDRYLGAMGLMDTPREAAKGVIATLRRVGIERMMMISGDNQAVADAVAKSVGLDQAFGDLMPDDKVTAIRKLSQNGGVAMVGDGVNDAPAMANATVGIAMGAAGSDVALETADVALMADNLNSLPFAVGLSRATNRIIRQNLWISLGVVAILVPMALAGLALGGVVLIHEGSTVVVVLNALRLLAYRAPTVSA